MKIVTKQWFEKVRNAFFGVMMSVMFLPFLLVACNSGEDGIPEENEEGQTELPTVQRILGGEQLIALAVCRVFDGNGMSAKSFSNDLAKNSSLSINQLNTDDHSLRIRYVFDFVEINAAICYIAQGIDFPFLNAICGEGEIEVFLTSFNTYRYADETKDENRLQPYISDGLIVFRGEWGIYSCMNNSGWFDHDDWDNTIYSLSEFSSHKRFGENAVEKDLTPPLYQFFVKNENNLTSLACNVVVDKDGNFQNKPLQWTILQGGETVSSENLFSMEELTVMSEMTQQCTITDIGKSYFMVSSEYNLQKVCFDEYTLFFAGDEPVESTEFATGDVVTVTFNQPYEKYNPKVAMANQIVK